MLDDPKTGRSVSEWTCIQIGRRSIVASAWRTTLLVLVGVLAGGALCFVEGSQLLDALEQAETDRSEGAYVYIVESTSGHLDADSCLGLQTVSGVSGTGGISSTESIRIRGGTPARRILVTPGFVRVVSDYQLPTTTELAVGALLAKQLGVAAGSYVEDGVGNVGRIDALLSSDLARSETMGHVVAQVAYSNAHLDQCLIEFQSSADALAQEIIRAGFINQYRYVTVRPLLFRDAGLRDLHERYSSRPSRLGWLVVGVVGGVLVGLSYRSRRAEIGLLAALGFTRRGRLVVVATDRLMPFVSGLFVGGTVALTALAPGRTLPHLVFHQSVLVLLYATGVVAATSTAAFLIVDRRDKLTLLKDL